MGSAGINNIDAIARVDGVDGIFIGPADLAAALGSLHDRTAPEVPPVDLTCSYSCWWWGVPAPGVCSWPLGDVLYQCARQPPSSTPVMTESLVGAQVEAKIKELLGKITAAGKPAGILWAGDTEKCKSTALAVMIVPSTTTVTCGRLMLCLEYTFDVCVLRQCGWTSVSPSWLSTMTSRC